MLHRFISVMMLYFDSDGQKVVYILLYSFIRVQGSSTQDFCVENCPLRTMVRGQIYAAVKCLQNKINNATAEKNLDFVLVLRVNPRFRENFVVFWE